MIRSPNTMARIPKERLVLYALVLSALMWVSIDRTWALAQKISAFLMQDNGKPVQRWTNGEFENLRIDSSLADSSCSCSGEDSISLYISDTPSFGVGGIAIAYSLSRRGVERFTAYALGDYPDNKRIGYRAKDSATNSGSKAPAYRIISSLHAYAQDSTGFLTLDGETWRAWLCDRRRGRNIMVEIPGKLDDTPNANRLCEAIAMMLDSIETDSDSINNIVRRYSATLKGIQ